MRLANPASLSLQIAAKAIFAVNTILLFARLTRYYGISSTLGPKVRRASLVVPLS